MPLTFEEDQARLERAAEAREKSAALFPAAQAEPPVGDEDPRKRAARDARAHRQAKRSESREVDDEVARLLNGENPDDAATLARVRTLRERQAALPAELAAAEDALALAESRLQPVLDAERAANMEGIQQAARKAERDLNARRKALSFEYHDLARRMAEIDAELNDPTAQAEVIRLLRSAGLS